MVDVVDIERYLRSATRGLWGRKRREVREELAAHIEERTVAFRLAGLSEEDAVERSLREMGEPGEVSEGMTRIYTLPTLFGSGTLLAAVCAVAVIAFSDSSAQSLPMDYRWPAEICLEASAQALPPKCKTDEPWLSAQELKENLEPLGVGVTKEKDSVTLAFPNAQPVRLTPPNINPEEYGSSLDTLNPTVQSEQLRKDYYPLTTIINEIASQAGVPVKLEGWENLTLQVGEVAFQLGTEAQPLREEKTYLFALLFWPLTNQPSFPKFFSQIGLIYTAWEDRDDSSKYGFESRHLEVGAEEGERYFLAAWLEPTPDDVAQLGRTTDNATLWYDIARGNADGTIDLRIPDNVTFVEKVDEQPALNTAVLIRFTDTFIPYSVATEREGYKVTGLGYDIVSPTQVHAVEEAR